MVFSSTLFLVYFLPVFLTIYFLIPLKLRNLFILLASIFFYAWGAPDFIFIVLGAIISDFYIVRKMSRVSGRNRVIWVSVSMILNIGLLAYFKYANFFVENVNDVLGGLGWNTMAWIKIALPIGISFFTFQKITYAVDVYRRVHAPLKSVVDYAMYILMFPQLIAGPIVRYNEIADQITERRKSENMNNRISGFFRFIIGLSKKVLIANVLGEEVDAIFDLDPTHISTSAAWIGIIAYAFQIYFDFSGYSDMAIGIGRMIGFTFPENFNNPYISGSITEFWRRWHMTLGRFMRDYLYIPLGGNRVSIGRMYFNLWIVFVISGLWHGAAWNFVIWGIFHGLFLVMDRLFLLRFFKHTGRIPAVVITFFITLIGWVFFRSDNLNYSFGYLRSMFRFNPGEVNFDFDLKFYSILIIAGLFSFIALLPGQEKLQLRIFGENSRTKDLIGMTIFSIFFFIICLATINSSGFNPFIYFRF